VVGADLRVPRSEIVLTTRGVTAGDTSCRSISGSPAATAIKRYVQTDLEADRQVATTLDELIIGGSLVSMEMSPSRGVM
jgi:hypothetical protein